MFAATVALGLDQITGRFTLILLTVAVSLGGCALLGVALFFLAGGDLASAWRSLAGAIDRHPAALRRRTRRPKRPRRRGRRG